MPDPCFATGGAAIGKLSGDGATYETIATFSESLFPDRIAAANGRVYFGTASRYYGMVSEAEGTKTYDSQ